MGLGRNLLVHLFYLDVTASGKLGNLRAATSHLRLVIGNLNMGLWWIVIVCTFSIEYS